MAASAAEKLAAAWTTRKERVGEADVGGLPDNVAEAVLAVEEASWAVHENVQLAEQLWAENPEHVLALEPDNHPQTSWAQRYEIVDGEAVEITKESATSPVTITYRPDLKVGEAVDPASALQARLQAPAEPEPVDG
jgi:hypothetical protein